MWGVYLFGSMLEQYMGSRKFLLLYFVSGLFAGIFWTLFNWNSPTVCVGASGALFGVMVGAAMLFPDTMILLLIPPIPLKLKTFAIIYALIETFSAFLGLEANVAHLAHIGGLIAGYVLMRFLYPNQTYDILKPLKAKLHIRPGKGFSKKASKRWTVTNTSRKKLDEILDKISMSGINSLTDEEIAILKQARENMRSQK
jgi:membrane associated rhomboid family serine protease